MSRKPYIPCAGGCGNLLYSGRGSLPPGQMTCKPCRRARRAPRPCAVCGTAFSPGPCRRYDVVTCSAACDNRYRRGILTADPVAAAERQRNRYRAKRRARRARAARTWDGVTDEQILDRDGWRCGICTRKINRRARWPHPDSRSIDHIVPLSQGGDDTATNKQAAHLGCNLRKGNRASGQLALFGMLGVSEPTEPAAIAVATAKPQATEPAVTSPSDTCRCGSAYLVAHGSCLACRLLGRSVA